MGTLESELRFLYNRVAQIECNTEQRLTDLGRKIHNLTKTVDNMQMSPCYLEPSPSDYRRTEESQSLKAGEDRCPSQPIRTSNHQHQPCKHKERQMSCSSDNGNNNYSSNKTYSSNCRNNYSNSSRNNYSNSSGNKNYSGSNYCSNYPSGSGNTGNPSSSMDHRDPCTREVCRIPSYSAHEADQLRVSVYEREKDIENQERELKDRRSQLVSRIKNLTDDVVKAAEAGLPPPYDNPPSPKEPSTPDSPPPQPKNRHRSSPPLKNRHRSSPPPSPPPVTSNCGSHPRDQPSNSQEPSTNSKHSYNGISGSSYTAKYSNYNDGGPRTSSKYSHYDCGRPSCSRSHSQTVY